MNKYKSDTFTKKYEKTKYESQCTISPGGENFLRKDLGLDQITLYSRDGADTIDKFHSDRLHAAMILVSTNDRKSFDSIGQWKDIVRK